VAVPFKECQFPLIYDVGVDRVDEISQVIIMAGFVIQAGAWFRVIDPETGEIMIWNGTELKFNGRAKLTEYMRETPDFLDYMEARVRGEEIEMPDIKGPVDEEGYHIENEDTEQAS